VSVLLGAALLLVLAGCESEAPPESYVARVGDQYLQETDVERMLRGMGPVPDSTEARQQVIEQWVERSLLLREARRLNLSQDAEVQRLLRERRRNTLVGAMTNRIHENMDQSPTDEEIRTYFERHREQLTLREPYVRVRHLTTTSIDSARAARQALMATSPSNADSVWARLSRTYGRHPSRSQRLADRFLPESRLFAQLPYVRDELSALQEGETAPVIEDNSRFHVLKLVRRVPEGVEPELRWVEAEIRRRLRVRRRKQMYAREVQRLRNRARADGLIETP
jgi:hypothetical protein